MLKNVVINVMINVITNVTRSMLSEGILGIDKTNAPTLTIKYKKKENSNIFLMLIFLDVPLKKIEPLLLIPGARAKDCIIPISIASEKEISSQSLTLFFEIINVKNNIIDVIIKAMLTNIEFVKYLSITSLKIRPIITEGILAIISLIRYSKFKCE